VVQYYKDLCIVGLYWCTGPIFGQMSLPTLPVTDMDVTGTRTQICQRFNHRATTAFYLLPLCGALLMWRKEWHPVWGLVCW